MTARLQISPDRDTFATLAADWPLVPVWAELLADVSTPVGLFPSLVGDGPGLLFESVERSERWGRYSFVAGDPAAVIVADREGVRVTDVVRPELPLEVPDAPPREALVALARSLRAPRIPELPRLTGGLMGYAAYEAAELLDGHPVPDPASAPCPPVGLLVIDRAVVFDHWTQRLILVAHVPNGAYDEGVAALEGLAATVAGATAPGLAPVPSGAAADIPGEPNMSDDRYREIVGAFKEHILAGDIFQGVPSRRVTFPAPDGGYPIYRRLRVANPAPYMFFVRMLGLELAGSSPEPLVRVRGPPGLHPAPRRHAAARARPRFATDCSSTSCSPTRRSWPSTRCSWTSPATTWGASASPGSVRPTQLMEVERFTKVMHIVSTVEGDLRDDLHPLDALAVDVPRRDR